MIYTITLNPAIDYVWHFDKFQLNTLNKSNHAFMYAAGKGIHVSKMLTNLGIENRALYLAGTENVAWFERDCQRQNLQTVPFLTKGTIRTNLKLVDEQAQTDCSLYQFNVEKEALVKMYTYLEKNLHENDYVIFSGSMPNNFKDEDYLKLWKLIKKKKCHLVIDISKPRIILLSLKFQPVFIKPNQDEFNLLKKYLQEEQNLSAEEVIPYLFQNGLQNLIISLGEKGAHFYNPKSDYQLIITQVFKSINTAGSGDSLVAGIVVQLANHQSWKKALPFGLACGSATALTFGISTKEEVKKMEKILQWNL